MLSPHHLPTTKLPTIKHPIARSSGKRWQQVRVTLDAITMIMKLTMDWLHVPIMTTMARILTIRSILLQSKEWMNQGKRREGTRRKDLLVTLSFVTVTLTLFGSIVLSSSLLTWSTSTTTTFCSFKVTTSKICTLGSTVCIKIILPKFSPILFPNFPPFFPPKFSWKFSKFQGNARVTRFRFQKHIS